MGTTQVRNPQMIDLLASEFQKREEVGFAWSRAVSAHMFLPGLTGLWPFSGLSGAGEHANDFAGNNQGMINTTAVTYALYGVTPYAIFDGSHYFRASSNTPNQITGALTVGCYAYFDGLGGTEGLISKWESTANQRCYRLYKTNTDVLRFSVSSNGVGETIVASSITPVVDTWYRIIGEYVPSTSLTIWVNGTKDQNTTSIPASIFDSASSDLNLGRSNSSNNFSGGMALASLQASAINEALAMLMLDYSRPLFGISL